MQHGAVFTQFHVIIEYRTKFRLAIWSDLVPAPNVEQATEMAERSLADDRQA